MKKNLPFFLKSRLHLSVLLLLIFSASTAYAQCTNGTLYPTGTFTVPCTGVPLALAADAYAGEYSNVSLTAGELYTFSSSVATDYITITNSGGIVIYAAGQGPQQLSPGSNEVVRFYLHKNAACATEDVNRTRFVTCNGPCSNPSSLVASNISSNSFQVNWQGTSPTYQIYASQNPATPTDPTIETQQGINGNSWLINEQLTYIYENTIYYVWVRSECINAPNPWIGPIQVTTNDFTPFCNTATFGLYPQATYSPACTGNQESIVADAYASEFSKVNIYANIQYTFTSSNTSDYISITNEAGTAVYSFGASPLIWNSGAISGVIRYHTYANSTCGVQAANRTRFIKCTQPPCSAPTNLSSSGVTTSSVVLNYSSPATPSGGYDYFVSTTNSAPTAATTPTGNSASLNVTVNGLASSTVYFFWVRSNCGAFKSAWVTGGSFTTLTGPPPCAPPSGFSASNITSNSVRLSWVANNSFDTYDVVLSTANVAPNASTTPSGTGLSINVLASPLSPATTYYYWVRANCGSSYSVWQAAGSFTTLVNGVGGCNGATYGKINIANDLPQCTGSLIELANGMKAGQYLEIGIQTNKQYTFRSTTNTDYFTVTNLTGNLVLGSGQAPYNWASGSNTGFVRVFMHSNAACGSSLTDRIVSVSCQNALGNEIFENSGMTVYPNPVKDVLNLSFADQIETVSVYNLMGQEVILKRVNAKEAKIDMSRLHSGTYLVKVSSGSETKTMKVLRE